MNISESFPDQLQKQKGCKQTRKGSNYTKEKQHKAQRKPIDIWPN